MEYGQRYLDKALQDFSGDLRAVADAMVVTAQTSMHRWLNVTMIVGGGLVIVGSVSLLTGLASASAVGTRKPTRT